MKVTIIECVFGILAFERKRIVETILFPKKAKKIVPLLQKIQKGEGTKELLKLVQNLIKKGYKQFIFENIALARKIRENVSAEIVVELPSVAGRFLRSHLAKKAIQVGYVKSTNEFYDIIYDVTNYIAKSNIQRKSGKKDLILSQAFLAFDDLEKTLNLFSNRLKEWYGLYFPELGSLVDKNETYIKLVSNLTYKKNFTENKLHDKGIALPEATTITKLAKKSMGAEIEKEELIKIRQLAKTLLQLYDLKNDLEKYITELMFNIAPNTQSLTGPILGARLITAGGGLETLMKKSSSKIQILGAEKALYRSFRTGSKPPKHGILFQHKAVHTAPRHQRGKIARSLAGKVAIALRLDYYSGEFRGNELRSSFENKIKEIGLKSAKK